MITWRTGFDNHREVYFPEVEGVNLDGWRLGPAEGGFVPMTFGGLLPDAFFRKVRYGKAWAEAVILGNPLPFKIERKKKGEMRAERDFVERCAWKDTLEIFGSVIGGDLAYKWKEDG